MGFELLRPLSSAGLTERLSSELQSAVNLGTTRQPLSRNVPLQGVARKVFQIPQTRPSGYMRRAEFARGHSS